VNPVDLSLNEFLIWALVLLRVGGVIVFAPFFGGDNLPRRARIGLAAFLALVTWHRAADTLGGMPLPLDVVDLALLAGREILVGAAFGYAGSLVFAAAQLAGELVGQQIGFTLANVVDPALDQEVGLVSYFKFSLAVLLFLAFDLHLYFLRALAMSYQTDDGTVIIGLGRSFLSEQAVVHLGDLMGRVWTGAVQLAGPILLVMLLVSVVVGFLTRTMPQLNIIVIGLPSRTFIGLLALVFGIRPFVLSMRALMEQMLFDVQYLLQCLGPEPPPLY
jgi:flagellar biosynthetic protein FliR